MALLKSNDTPICRKSQLSEIVQTQNLNTVFILPAANQSIAMFPVELAPNLINQGEIYVWQILQVEWQKHNAEKLMIMRLCNGKGGVVVRKRASRNLQN